MLALWHNCCGLMSLRTNWQLGLDLIPRRCFTCAPFYGRVDNVCARKSMAERELCGGGLKSQHDSLAGRNGWQAETEMCRPLMALNVAWP